MAAENEELFIPQLNLIQKGSEHPFLQTMHSSDTKSSSLVICSISGQYDFFWKAEDFQKKLENLTTWAHTNASSLNMTGNMTAWLAIDSHTIFVCMHLLHCIRTHHTKDY